MRKQLTTQTNNLVAQVLITNVVLSPCNIIMVFILLSFQLELSRPL